MNFGAQMKKLRAERKLTQEQVAEKLCVSRQAVSNWENDRNLPDIEMLIIMSQTFNVSLDELILGEHSMNNMTQKLIRDGSEVRKSRMNLVGVIIGAVFMLLGVICLVIKMCTPVTFDAEGYLQENFYLLPVAFFFFFDGFVVFMIMGIANVIGLLFSKDVESRRSRLAYFGICGSVILMCIGMFLLLFASNGADEISYIVPASIILTLLSLGCLLFSIRCIIRDRKMSVSADKNNNQSVDTPVC